MYPFLHQGLVSAKGSWPKTEGCNWETSVRILKDSLSAASLRVSAVSLGAVLRLKPCLSVLRATV